MSEREEAKELSEFMYGDSCFDFDDMQNKAQDNQLLLAEVAERRFSLDWFTALNPLTHSTLSASVLPTQQNNVLYPQFAESVDKFRYFAKQ